MNLSGFIVENGQATGAGRVVQGLTVHSNLVSRRNNPVLSSSQRTILVRPCESDDAKLTENNGQHENEEALSVEFHDVREQQPLVACEAGESVKPGA
jgi:hypothetical protein